ncbi:MAG: hypothetical protein ACQEXG_04955 [Pseudomonadota bacterium]
MLVPLMALASPQSGQFSTTLDKPESQGFYRPEDVLKLDFSDAVSPEWKPFIRLELDSIDVTEMVTWESLSLLYQPVRAMSAEEHELRLMYYGEDGSVEELGYWTFQVRQTAAFKTIRVEGNSELTANQRLAEHNMAGPEAFNASGFSQWYSELEADHLRIEGHADLEYVNQASQGTTGRRLDMTRMTLLAETETARVAAGDQQMGDTSLIMDGYQQRGMAGDISLADLQSDMRLFSMSSTRNLGLRDGIGLDDDDNRITGGRWQTRWEPGDSTEIQFSSTYLSGRVSSTSASKWSANPVNRVHDGDAWNAVMDGFFLDRSLRMRFEHATSRYDFDGRDFGFEAVEDNAWSGLITLDPEPSEAETPIHWSFGVEAQKVGAFYRSLAHRALPNDLYMRRLFVSGERDKWFWDTSFTVEEDNVDSNASYPTTETRRWNAQLGYSDYEEPEPGSIFAYLGQPSYTLSLDRSRRKDLSTPSSYFPEDLTTEGVQLGASFQKERWNWSVDAGMERLTDHTGWQPDTHLQHLGWQLGLELSDSYYLTAGIQDTRTRYRAGGESTDQQLYSLGATAELIPDRLSARLDITLDHYNAEDDPYFAQRQVSRYASGQLNWTLREADTNRAGLELTLSYSGNQLRDRLSGSEPLNEDQIWLKVQTTLPNLYPSTRP